MVDFNSENKFQLHLWAMFFYQIFIQFYGIAIRLVALFNRKATLFLQGRNDWQTRYEDALQQTEKPIWVHCASLGEFEQGRPLIEKIKKDFPSKKIVVTFFSPSGFEIQKNYKSANAVFYLPLDTKKNAKDFIKILKPQFVVFVKYEFWLNYLNELHFKKIPTYIISTKFRSDQIFFKWYGGIFKTALQHFKTIFVQDEMSKNLLQKIKVENVQIAADTRFDRVFQNAQNVNLPAWLHKFCDGKNILIAGSTWQADEEILLQWQKKYLPKNWKMIWVPHEIAELKIKNLELGIGGNTILFSEIESQKNELKNEQHLIIDTIGLLSKIYSVGKIAYIGGGFGSGIHNILEPAVFGLPVFFGPKFEKFNEAIDLQNLGGSFSFQTENEFSEKINSLIKNEAELNRVGKIAKNFVEKNIGGTAIIMTALQTDGLLTP